MLAEAPKVVKRPTLEENLGLAYSAALEFVRSSKVNVEDTDEYSDALMALWKACESWDENKEKFSTYAHLCMRNAILNGRRNRNSHSVATTNVEELKDVAQIIGDFEKLDIEDIIRSLFTKVPGETRLDRRCKKVLFQKYMENASWEELGEKFGVTRSAACQWGIRAIKLLREQMNGNSNLREK